MRDNEKTSEQYKREVLSFAIPQFYGIVFSSNRKPSYGQSQLDHYAPRANQNSKK